MKKIIFGAIGASILISIVVSQYFFPDWNIANTDVISSEESTTKKIYEHIFPEQITKSDYFQGVFVQNDVAGIYPRRDALVKDILVDIGDTVQEWQTLAILFEPGVSGQSGSNINLKSTILGANNKTLTNTKEVANAKIAEFDAKIHEKEVYLAEILNNLDIQISQAQNVYDTKSEFLDNNLELQKQILITLETNLENAQETKMEKIEAATQEIAQRDNILDAKVDEIYIQIVPLIYVGRNAQPSATGALSDIAPTVLTLMGLPQPEEMTGSNLMKLD